MMDFTPAEKDLFLQPEGSIRCIQICLFGDRFSAMEFLRHELPSALLSVSPDTLFCLRVPVNISAEIVAEFETLTVDHPRIIKYIGPPSLTRFARKKPQQ